MRRAFELWSDEASRREYVSQVLFRLHLDYDGLRRPGPEEHYFPDLFRLMPDEVLVDCGAFDGCSRGQVSDLSGQHQAEAAGGVPASGCRIRK